MADRRPDIQEMSLPRAKKQRTGEKGAMNGSSELDPTSNPYLAHMYPKEEETRYNSYSSNSTGATALESFVRHQTTAAQADKAERGPNNPFNNKPLSDQYFRILEKRQDLPVHKQRYAETLVPFFYASNGK